MEASLSSPLETFDYVVVLMLENRSFDNILGYLYRDGVPAGSKFEGVVGKELSNPAINGTPIPVSANAEVHQPNPDPGEEFHHVTMQLFSAPQASGIPAMKGFVTDYYGTLQALRRQYRPGLVRRRIKACKSCGALLPRRCRS